VEPILPAASSTPSKRPEATIPPPTRADNLRLTAPITSWEDALPLGNGLMGALMWGEENVLRLSLDRGDLWDERTHGEQEWWKKHPWDAADQETDPWGHHYEGLTPTKLPAGRVELRLNSGQRLEDFELDLATAHGTARTATGATVQAFVSAAEPILMLRVAGSVTGSSIGGVDLVPAGAGDGSFANTHSGGAVGALGYPPAQRGSANGMCWYVQEAADGFSYCACVAVQDGESESLAAIAITTSDDADGSELLALAQRRCAEALAAGYDTMREPHTAWWETFWAESSVTIPEPTIQRNYQFNRYLYGAGSRKSAPPMPLQGVWTADNGGLPPWKGDYHNDLNTQLSYCAYQEAGNFESGESYLDFLWDLTPVFRDFARDFYGTSGLASPGVMSRQGQPLGGWSQYAMSPTMSAWNAHMCYLHWRYTDDHKFLVERAYPWSSEVGQCLEELLGVDDDGKLVLPRSSSPEIFDNSAQAWLKPNSNYDLMCLKMLFLSLAEMAQAQSLGADRLKWLSLANALGDFHATGDGELLLDADTPLTESHRHLSNLIGIYPFNLISIDGGEQDVRRIRRSLEAWDALGTQWWTGYSWAWMGCLRARVGDGEEAARHVEVYANAFVSRNGFHVNGDQSGKGYSSFTYRPFTLEGNFAAMQVVQEMLLQSWSPTPGTAGTEIIRIFPAMPDRWASASFSELRAEGGHKVSAMRDGGRTTSFTVVAGKDGMLKIRDNFAGLQPNWSVDGVVKVGDDFHLPMLRGGTVSATLEPELELAGTTHGAGTEGGTLS
jgi:alpha-L-fucosidase 2